MRRLRISESLIERNFENSWQYKVLLNRSETQELVVGLLGLLYGLVDELEVFTTTRPICRFRCNEGLSRSARISPNEKLWRIELSQAELEAWLTFLTASLTDAPSVDHIDLIDETRTSDLQFTLAIIEGVYCGSAET